MPKYEDYGYNIHGYDSDPLAQQNGLPSSLLGFGDDLVGGLFFDNPDWSSQIMGELLGYNAQQREFAQQEYMFDKEQAIKDPVYQMNRMKAAGINPNMAAQGISGSPQSASPASVSSASGAAASGFGSIAQGVQSLSNANVNSALADKNKADAEFARANARNADRLADAVVMEKFGILAQSLTKSGMPEIKASQLALKVVRNGIDGLEAVLSADDAVRIIDDEQRNLQAQYDLQLKQYEAEKAKIRKLEGEIEEQDYINQLAAIDVQIRDLDLWFAQSNQELWKRYDGDPNRPIYELCFDMAKKFGGYDTTEYQNWVRSLYESSYHVNLGINQAEVTTMYNKVWQSLKADAEWKPYMNMLDEKKQAIMNLLNLFSGADDSTALNVVKMFLITNGRLEIPTFGNGSEYIPSVSAPKENGDNFSN